MKLFTLLTAITMFATPSPQGDVVVDRIEGNYAVCEVELGVMKDVALSDLNVEVKEGDIIDTKTTSGYISGTFTDLSGRTLYQFKSYDDKVWWALTAEEIGYVPEEGADYIICYSDNGTTEGNKPCDCAEVYDCECEVYDDIFFALWESRV